MIGPRRQRFFKSIRFQLMLSALSLIFIPWAGYRYVQGNEAFLRETQVQGLYEKAQYIATLLASRPKIFINSGNLPGGASGPPLYINPVAGPIQLDGYPEEWRPYLYTTQHVDTGGPDGFDLTATGDSQSIYLLIQVKDDQVILRQPGTDNAAAADAVNLLLMQPGGELHSYLISTSAPGWVDITETTDDPQASHSISGIRGEWQNSSDGYTVELRLSRRLVGSGLALTVQDYDRNASDQLSKPIHTVAGSERISPLVSIEPEIQKTIDQFSPKQTRVRILDRFHNLLAESGHLQGSHTVQTGSTGKPGVQRMLFNLILQQPDDQFDDQESKQFLSRQQEIRNALQGKPDSQRRRTMDNRAVIVSAAWPIIAESGVIGAVLVEQTTNRILSLQKQAMEGLFNLTFLLFAATSLILLIFATRLTSRIHKLRNRVETAVATDGRILTTLNPDAQKDEIGDLQRSFSSVLKRLGEYNDYLEAMTSRLSHELRTPLTVVSSSLENLANTTDGEQRKRYIERANQGVKRLSIILQSMREATRLEQGIWQVTRERFNLTAMLCTSVESYRSAFPGLAIEYHDHPEAIFINGSPDLLSQALDKLIANARDFHTRGTALQFHTKKPTPELIEIILRNQGPLIQEGTEAQVFNSMVSLRNRHDGTPHLGLGLYIVKLICSFHGGRVRAGNLSDGTGVEFVITLPIVH